MKIDFARLNYVLIPKTKEGRDRFRDSRTARAIAPIMRTYGSLTDEGRTLAIVTMLVGAFSIDVLRTSGYLFFALLVGVLLGSLAAARRLVIDDVTLSVVAPRHVRVDEDVRFALTCTTRGGITPPLRVRGPFLTWDGKWVSEAPSETRAKPTASASFEMRARFAARGLHHLDPFSAAAIAPLGLACGPRIRSDAIKVWVVPRVADVQRLPLPLVARHQPGGVALASKSGEAMDLAGVRPYRAGDPVRDLHAKTWARTGIPVVREYQQEYFTRVGVILDTDIADPDFLEAAIEVTAGAIAHLSRGDALVDVLVVGNTVHELTLGRSLGYLDQALELLSEVERGPKLDAPALLRRLEGHIAQVSSVVVIASKSDPSADGASRSSLDALAQGIRDRGAVCAVIAVDREVLRALRAKEPLAW